MKIAIAQKRGYTQIDLDGVAGDDSAGVVREEIDHLLASSPKAVLWNVPRLAQVGRSVFCEILRGMAWIRLGGGTSVLLSPCAEIRGFITQLGLDGVMNIAADEGIAVRRLQPVATPRRSEFVSSSLLGEILIDLGVLDEGGLRRALEEQRNQPGQEKLGSILLKLDIVTPTQMMSALETQYQRRIQRLGAGSAPPPPPSAAVKRNLLGQILQEIGVVDEAGLKKALEEQRRGGSSEKLGDILLRLRIVTPDQLLRALEAQARR